MLDQQKMSGKPFKQKSILHNNDKQRKQQRSLRGHCLKKSSIHTRGYCRDFLTTHVLRLEL